MDGQKNINIYINCYGVYNLNGDDMLQNKKNLILTVIKKQFLFKNFEELNIFYTTF